MKDKNDTISCPTCGKAEDNHQIKCKHCNFVPEEPKDLWKPANLGKQRKLPKANRTGKK